MGRAEIAKQVARFASVVPELASLQPGQHFRNLVVGGGPAGYAVTSTLLDGGSSPILWVDPVFQSGRLAQYLEVRVCLAQRLPSWNKFTHMPSKIEMHECQKPSPHMVLAISLPGSADSQDMRLL